MDDFEILCFQSQVGFLRVADVAEQCEPSVSLADQKIHIIVSVEVGKFHLASGETSGIG